MPINLELIKNASSINDLPDNALLEISRQASYLSVKSGATLFDCGNSCELLFFVLNGPIIEESHQQIADELGSVREIISRLLKQFEEHNWVILARKKIEVTNPDGLRDFSREVW